MQTPSPASSTDNCVETIGNPRQVSVARMMAFSGGEIGTPNWPASNIHTDLAKAKGSGLKDVIASGMQAEGYLIAMILDEFGEKLLYGGTMSIKHIGMVSPGDVVVPKIKMRTAEKQGVPNIKLDVRCELSEGRPVVIGEAELPR